jgi:hypothetical protein
MDAQIRPLQYLLPGFLPTATASDVPDVPSRCREDEKLNEKINLNPKQLVFSGRFLIP